MALFGCAPLTPFSYPYCIKRTYLVHYAPNAIGVDLQNQAEPTRVLRRLFVWLKAVYCPDNTCRDRFLELFE